MTNFTPGPWKLNPDEQIVDGAGQIICHMLDRYCNSGIEDQSEHYENAVLLSKSPELFEALEELCNELKWIKVPEIESLARAVKVLESTKKKLALSS